MDFHWMVAVGVPVTVTEKVALEPRATDCDAGAVTVGTEPTVNAVADVAVAPPLITVMTPLLPTERLGTVAVIDVSDTTANVAEVPLN